MNKNKDKKIIKSPHYSLEKFSENSKLVKKGLRDLSIWPKIEDLFQKSQEKYSAGLIDECMKLCLEVLATDPYHLTALMYYIWCLDEKGEHKKCVEYCTRYLNEESDELLVLGIRGRCYYAMKDYNKALDDYKKILALDKDPINGMNLNYIAYCSFELGDFKGAHDYIDQAISIELISIENSGDILMLNKAFFLEHQEKMAEALEQYIKTLSKFPNSEHAQKKIVDLSNRINHT